MQGLLGGFLSPEAGQARRAWLNEQDQRIDGVLSYFLGPQLMPRVRGAVGAANELTDFADYRDAVLGADQMATGATTADRIAGAGTMATGLAAMMVPGVSARMAEGATDVAGDLARFIADEDGSLDFSPQGWFNNGGPTQTGDDARALDPARLSLPPGSDPRYLGAAPDRSDFSYLRYEPSKPSPRLQASLEAMADPNNPARIALEADIARGAELGGMDWYNTEELRDWFIDAWGEAEGDAQWREFMYLMGTTSPGSRVEPNIANASAVRRRLREDPEYLDQLLGVESLADAGAVARGRAPGYGHKTQGLQELLTARFAQGDFTPTPEPGTPSARGSWVMNPKPKGFANSLLGNRANIAADLHFTRYMAMASSHPDWLENVNDVSDSFASRIMSAYPESAAYFKKRSAGNKEVWSFSPKKAVKDGVVPLDAVSDYPSVWASKPNDNEYAAFEKFIRDFAEENGMTPAQAQANLWMGAADRTGVDPDSQGTFMEILRNRAAKTARREGITAEEVMSRFIRNNGLLSAAGLAALGMSANELQAAAAQQGSGGGW